MNLTGREPYQKGDKRISRGKSRPATKTERAHWERVRALGCLLDDRIFEGGFECEGRITIHHCGTGGGGHKKHKLVIPLCVEHHTGAKGIDGQRMSKRDWQEKYGSEESMLEKVNKLLRNL